MEFPWREHGAHASCASDKDAPTASWILEKDNLSLGEFSYAFPSSVWSGLARRDNNLLYVNVEFIETGDFGTKCYQFQVLWVLPVWVIDKDIGRKGQSKLRWEYFIWNLNNIFSKIFMQVKFFY